MLFSMFIGGSNPIQMAMDFFTRDACNHERLVEADPDRFRPGRFCPISRQPIVIRPSEIHKLLRVPRSAFTNILFYRGNFYVSPVNELTYKYVGLTVPNPATHPDWIPMPVCFLHNPLRRKKVRSISITLPNLKPVRRDIPHLETLAFYGLPTKDINEALPLLYPHRLAFIE